MLDSPLVTLLHGFTGLLLEPVLVALGVAVVVCVWDSGTAVGERFSGLRRLAAGADPARVEALARRRIERVDLVARLAPMLGLMGTLIPLGPGLAALGRGELDVLATAVTVAFDTTVVGLLAGAIAFVIGRLRRRWYEGLLEALGA
ncbi:MotA/TolQ/ExbB proton channel family protein [Spiribacter halobius]|uniref:MotA/TolQ/ExbB proton channel family protein n=1 Tax=Sediminicurvatus halobius TaxID=2182432 RepID=UPI001E286880|nr:MotA/TolQ/ExbB proton channel family protein [Spiribacter halobius]UEX77594.1 MotA/TolQ/ExbB proton channel family protein [Spiribacter halobius]